MGCEGQGNLGVRFDVSTRSTHRKLNELGDGKVTELAVVSLLPPEFAVP